MQNETGGGKPTFLTCEAALVEWFKVSLIAGQEEGLAPLFMVLVLDWL